MLRLSLTEFHSSHRATSTHLGALSGLTYFSLETDNLQPDSPVRQLWALPGLKVLHLYFELPDAPRVDILHDMASSLHHLQGLAVMDVYGLPLTQGLAEALAQLPKLYSLEVGELHLSGPLQSPALRLKHFAVSHCASAEQWAWLLGGTTSLRNLSKDSSLELFLPRVQENATSALSSVARSVSECAVGSLSLQGNAASGFAIFSAAQVLALRPMTSQLVEVALRLLQLPAAALEAAITCFPRLSTLRLFRCSFVDLVAGLDALLRLPRLARLELDDCRGLNAAAFESFLGGFTRPLRVFLNGLEFTAAAAPGLLQMLKP